VPERGARLMSAPRPPRRSHGPVAVVLAAVLAVGALAFALHERAALDATRARVASARHTLATDDADLASTRAGVRTTTAQLDARQASVATAFEALVTARNQLTGAAGDVQLQQLDLATLHSCLDGVEQATLSEAGGDDQSAVDDLTGVSASCTSLDATQTGSGLVYPFDFPDPFVLTVGNEYYAYASNSAAGNIQIIESSDLTHWTTVGDALPHLASWAQPGATWAPSVLHLGSSYILYYSAIFGTSGEQCVSAATSATPQGPFLDTSTEPVVCQLGQGGSLDPSPYVDTTGQPYLTWKSEGTGSQGPVLWAQPLGPSGTGLLPGTPTALLQPGATWQGGVVEGPDMVDLGGTYALFYSGNQWSTAAYAVGEVGCAGPLGPCQPATGAPLLASGPAFSGPGGESVFADAQGTLWMAFHAWLPGEVGYPHSRVLFLRRLTVTGGVPTVDGT